jgi:hypothetical protein
VCVCVCVCVCACVFVVSIVSELLAHQGFSSLDHVPAAQSATGDISADVEVEDTG